MVYSIGIKYISNLKKSIAKKGKFFRNLTTFEILVQNCLFALFNLISYGNPRKLTSQAFQIMFKLDSNQNVHKLKIVTNKPLVLIYTSLECHQYKVVTIKTTRSVLQLVDSLSTCVSASCYCCVRCHPSDLRGTCDQWITTSSLLREASFNH